MEKPNPNKAQLPKQVQAAINDILKFLEDAENVYVGAGNARLHSKEDDYENS